MAATRTNSGRASLKPTGSFFAGLLFLASAIGGIWLEYSATLGYDAQPYQWLIESMSDLGVPYRQVHPLKHHTVISYRARTWNFGLMVMGSIFAWAQFHLLARTRTQAGANVATFRLIRTMSTAMFVAGAFLMASIYGGPRERHWKTIGWHWNGFALMALAGNLNSVVAGLAPGQVGGLDDRAAYRLLSVALGVVGIASFVKFHFLLGQWNHLTRLGLWQRGSLYPVAAWQVLTGVGLIGAWATGSKRKRA